MRIHLLGICGTFMAGLAVLAKEKGYQVSGTDSKAAYPPMNHQLASHHVNVRLGYDSLPPINTFDRIIVGNAMMRGLPIIESMLKNPSIPYCSGPQWLYENILKDKHVLAVAGTHGKTTTSSLLAWILEFAGLNPGFLIGGIPENFGVSARLGKDPFFVVEADEYDSAFFDKRSKFIHYHPRTLILNNLEYDHADIFPNLDLIKKQFQDLAETIAGDGLIISNADDENLKAVLSAGCWTQVNTFGHDDALWRAIPLQPDGSFFEVYCDNQYLGNVKWDLVGQHNVYNALAAMAAAQHVGVPAQSSIEALTYFKGVKRRLEIRGCVNNITVYDDFAHHPTAIATTLAGLRAKVGCERIFAVIEFSSYTMKHGFNLTKEILSKAFKPADVIMCKKPEATWDFEKMTESFYQPVCIHDTVDDIIDDLLNKVKPGNHVVIMSCIGFDSIHTKLLSALQSN